MEIKNYKKEIDKNLKEMSKMDSTTEDYQKKLNTVIKLTNMMDKASKIEGEAEKDKKESLDDERSKFNKEVKEKELSLEEDKLFFEKQKFSTNSKNQRKENLIKIFLGIASIAGPIIVTVIGVVSNHRLAMRSLNMEYIDNGITPRLYNECRQNIRSFVKK